MSDEVEMIDLNQADVETLATLPGIGSALAERIVEYRQTVHPFEEVIELAAVPGISERIVRNFEDRVTVVTPSVVEVVTQAAGAELIQPGAQERESEVQDTSQSAIAPGVSPEVLSETAGDSDAILLAVDDTDTYEAGDGEAELTPAAELDSAPPPPPPMASREVEETGGQPPAAMPSTLAAELEKKAQRRGCFVLVGGAVLGAVVGAILSLAILATLNNGTLSFAQTDAQLRRDLQGASRTQAELNDQLSLLEAKADELAARSVELAEQQEAADASLANLQQTIMTIEREINTLETVTENLDEQLASVAAAAETFDAFLDSLRDLLFDLQGPPPTPSPTALPTGTATPAATTAPGTSENETPEISPTSAGQPTRTPRPTATLILTSTPEPQP
jgi:TolA-binding protein